MNIVRCTAQVIDPHEKRRGDHPRMPRLDGDILRGLRYWRWCCRTGAHAAKQYVAHCEIAYRPALAQLRMAEAAIRMSVACDDALAAWRAAS